MTTIILHDERAPSWNNLYVQRHWSQRKRLVDEIKLKMRAAMDAEPALHVGPVHITVTAVYKRAPVDCDNVCCKPFIDALCGWVIADDDTKHVESVTLISVKGKRDKVIVEVCDAAHDLDQRQETTR